MHNKCPNSVLGESSANFCQPVLVEQTRIPPIEYLTFQLPFTVVLNSRLLSRETTPGG